MEMRRPRQRTRHGLAVLAALSAAALGTAGPSSSAPAPAASAGATQTACSKAAALEVAKEFFVWGTDVRTPVGEVLCGSFAGPGSQSMAVTLTAPTCWPRQGWLVYTLVDGSWQLTLKQTGVFLGPPLPGLKIEGSSIRETVPVRRRGDSRCNPSGGTRSRLWSWNGSRLVAGAWQQASAGKPQERPTKYFASPSGNIQCWIDPAHGRAGCTTRQPQWSAILTSSGGLTIRRLRFDCGCEEPSAPRLSYGRQISYGGFRCSSRETGVRCVVAETGKGFLINRDGVTRVG
jgi:hypothetical protein